MASIINASTSSGLAQSADTSGQLELQSNGSTKLTVASTGVTIPTLTTTTLTGTTVTGTITNGTAVASTSGTSIDFTSIPSWVKRVVVLFNGVSGSGTSQFLIQIGSGSVTTTGYVGGATNFSGGTQASSTAGFLSMGSASTAATAYTGRCVIELVTGNTYIGSTMLGSSTTTGGGGGYGAGNVTLSGALDRVRITTVGGTDTFDAGSINIQYEG